MEAAGKDTKKTDPKPPTLQRLPKPNGPQQGPQGRQAGSQLARPGGWSPAPTLSLPVNGTSFCGWWEGGSVLRGLHPLPEPGNPVPEAQSSGLGRC